MEVKNLKNGDWIYLPDISAHHHSFCHFLNNLNDGDEIEISEELLTGYFGENDRKIIKRKVVLKIINSQETVEKQGEKK